MTAPNVVDAPIGAKGFDANVVIRPEIARAFRSAGYVFAVRYVPRELTRSNDLTTAEIASLFSAGLALMLVQHVESEASWIPSAEKGRTYARNAVDAARALGVPKGVTLWLDLEGVDPTVPPAVVIGYCNAWCDAVDAAGYGAGLYVGWHCGLAPAQLYGDLHFQRYWAAYNLDSDQEPAVRGVCMRQHAAKPADIPPGVAFPIDVDVVLGDHLEGVPTLFAPDEWDARASV